MGIIGLIFTRGDMCERRASMYNKRMSDQKPITNSILINFTQKAINLKRHLFQMKLLTLDLNYIIEVFFKNM